MSTLRLRQRLALVQQSETTVTAPRGGSPVIRIDRNEPIAEVAMAVNFLRSGASSVQFLVGDNVPWKKVSEKMEKYVKALELPDEEFNVTPLEEKGDEEYVDGFVIILDYL